MFLPATVILKVNTSLLNIS